MSKSIVTPIGRASFPNIAKVDQYGHYSIGLLLPKNGKGVTEFVSWLKEAVQQEAVATAGPEKVAEAMQNFSAFKDGDNVAAFKTYRAEYAGHWVLQLRRKSDYGKPCVVNKNKQPIDPSEIYAGCNICVYIDVYGYTFGMKKGVSIGVQHILKAGENTPFASTGVSVESAFGDMDIPEENEQPLASPVQGTPTPAQPVSQPVQPAAPAADPFAGI